MLLFFFFDEVRGFKENRVGENYFFFRFEV